MSARAPGSRRRSLTGIRAFGVLLAAGLIAATSPAYAHASRFGGESDLLSFPRSPRSEFVVGALGPAPRTNGGSPALRRPLFRRNLDLRAQPVKVPLELRIPSLKIRAPILGVGITPSGVMDAPMGSSEDPVWQQAFWYRGGGVPGDVGTATIAGHLRDGPRPALFEHLHKLLRGHLIIVHDVRSGVDIRFAVTASKTYSLEQLADTSVLERIYGPGPVSGRGPLPAPDGVSHLTLITCAGHYSGSSYDHRLMVYAERTN